jgi:hypothetical protein
MLPCIVAPCWHTKALNRERNERPEDACCKPAACASAQQGFDAGAVANVSADNVSGPPARISGLSPPRCTRWNAAKLNSVRNRPPLSATRRRMHSRGGSLPARRVSHLLSPAPLLSVLLAWLTVALASVSQPQQPQEVGSRRRLGRSPSAAHPSRAHHQRDIRRRSDRQGRDNRTAHTRLRWSGGAACSRWSHCRMPSGANLSSSPTSADCRWARPCMHRSGY